jgi:ankyrin repeat protein
MGRTALMIAAECGHQDVSRCLLDYGADINVLNLVRKCVSHFAGKDNVCTQLGKSAAMFACEGGHINEAIYLVENGALIDKPDREGKTTLDAANNPSYRKYYVGQANFGESLEMARLRYLEAMEAGLK